MAIPTNNNARLNFRLPRELKQTIEEAAALSGLTVTDFAISVLSQNSQNLIQEHETTALSTRDRDVFIAILDQADARPNDALRTAADRYKKFVG